MTVVNLCLCREIYQDKIQMQLTLEAVLEVNNQKPYHWLPLMAPWKQAVDQHIYRLQLIFLSVWYSLRLAEARGHAGDLTV